jgi:hypothetical protein
MMEANHEDVHHRPHSRLTDFLRSANAAPLIDAARARAIHDCNVAASTYKQYLWGHFESDTYRACMAEHGQTE